MRTGRLPQGRTAPGKERNGSLVIVTDQAICGLRSRLEGMKTAAFALLLAVSTAAALGPLPLMETVTVGKTELNTKALPKGFVLREEIGLVTAVR